MKHSSHSLTRSLTLAGTAMLLSTAVSFGEIQVAVAHNSGDKANEHFKFDQLPSPTADNAAAKGTFTIVAGAADENGGSVSVLNDGKLPAEEDQPENNFFFAAGSEGGRVQLDLGSAIDIKAVNTYSWHPNTRGPQVYKLYASDGAADGFNAKPGNDVDPEKAGWKLVASVDTRPKAAGADGGGQYAVSVTDSAGTLGKYRYLLFAMTRTEADDDFGNTFYSEINVLGADAGGGAGAVQVNLAPFYNLAGIFPDGAEFTAGLDAGGFACSSNLLGSARTWNSVNFTLGSATGPNNVVTCAGQVITLPPGKYSSLQMLALAVNGNQETQTFGINYADGGDSQSINQNMSDWFTPSNYTGESQVLTMPYRVQSDSGKDEQTFYLYGYSFNLNKANTVQGFKLPDNVDLKIFAITLVP